MHHLLAVLVGALSGAMSATAPIYARTADLPDDAPVAGPASAAGRAGASESVVV